MPEAPISLVVLVATKRSLLQGVLKVPQPVLAKQRFDTREHGSLFVAHVACQKGSKLCQGRRGRGRFIGEGLRVIADLLVLSEHAAYIGIGRGQDVAYRRQQDVLLDREVDPAVRFEELKERKAVGCR